MDEETNVEVKLPSRVLRAAEYFTEPRHDNLSCTVVWTYYEKTENTVYVVGTNLSSIFVVPIPAAACVLDNSESFIIPIPKELIFKIKEKNDWMVVSKKEVFQVEGKSRLLKSCQVTSKYQGMSAECDTKNIMHYLNKIERVLKIVKRFDEDKDTPQTDFANISVSLLENTTKALKILKGYRPDNKAILIKGNNLDTHNGVVGVFSECEPFGLEKLPVWIISSVVDKSLSPLYRVTFNSSSGEYQ